MATDQQSLSGLMWERYEVPAVKLSLSGSQELPMDVLTALDLSDLEPGDNVVLSVGCTVRRLALDDADGKRRGLVALRLETVRGAEVTG